MRTSTEWTVDRGSARCHPSSHRTSSLPFAQTELQAIHDTGEASSTNTSRARPQLRALNGESIQSKLHRMSSILPGSGYGRTNQTLHTSVDRLNPKLSCVKNNSQVNCGCIAMHLVGRHWPSQLWSFSVLPESITGARTTRRPSKNKECREQRLLFRRIPFQDVTVKITRSDAFSSRAAHNHGRYSELNERLESVCVELSYL